MAKKEKELPLEEELPLEDEETSSSTAAGGAFLDQIGPHASKILIGAAVLGLISIFIPLASFMGISISLLDSWQGKVCLAGYIGIGALGGVMLAQAPILNKNLVFGALGAGGLVLLLALWVLFQVAAFATVLNLLACLVAVGASVILAKQAKVF